MLVIVSPAKRLNEQPAQHIDFTQPELARDAKILADTAKKLGAEGLGKLMGISEKLAALNEERFNKFGTGEGEKQAIELFSGDTYAGYDAPSLTDDERRYAAEHLCILSGLYGILRPCDKIAPYRLEMGTRMKNPRGNTLYEFWGTSISAQINARAEKTDSEILVNCASVEYFKAVKTDALNLRVITPQFYELRDSKPKIISFSAKKARGAMARYIVQNRVTNPLSLKDFDLGGYQFSDAMSDQDTFAFVR